MDRYYRLLGVEPTATLDEIKAAFRRLARRVHPDVNGSPDAAERFKAVKHAYEVLTELRRDREPAAAGHRPRVAQDWRPQYRVHVRHAYARRNPDFLERLADRLAGIFADRLTPDLEVRLSPTEAFFGGRFELEVPVALDCPRCGGWGSINSLVCPVCRGKGAIVATRPYILSVPGPFKGRDLFFARPVSGALGERSLVVLVHGKVGP